MPILVKPVDTAIAAIVFCLFWFLAISGYKMALSGIRNHNYEVECAICSEPFVEPRQLPCSHVYCVECLERWVNNEGQWPRLTCPTCREEFHLPDNGTVRDLPFPVPDFDDSDDLDLSSFEIVADFWADSGTADEQPGTSDVQPDNWIDHNVNDVMVDVINRNISVASTEGDDVPTGGPLDNEGVMSAQAELHENEQGF